MTDPFQGKEWEAFVDRVIENMIPELRESALVCSIVPEDVRGDVKFWVELGASIMMNKPIIAVCFHKQAVPPKLALIADEIIRIAPGDTGAAADQISAALARMGIGD